MKKAFDLKSYLVSVLRRAWRHTPAYSEARKNAKEEYFIPGKTVDKIRRVHYKCAKCGRYFDDKPGQRGVAVDHVEPVILPTEGFCGWDKYVDRMFNGKLQILCGYKGEVDGVKSCHYYKTQSERAMSRILKKPVGKLFNDEALIVAALDYIKIDKALKRHTPFEFYALRRSEENEYEVVIRRIN